MPWELILKLMFPVVFGPSLVIQKFDSWQLQNQKHYNPCKHQRKSKRAMTPKQILKVDSIYYFEESQTLK